MTIDIQMEQAIIRRVKFIYLMRLFAKPILIESFILIATAMVIVFSISVPDVVSNFYHLEKVIHCLSYFANSFVNTEFTVQAMIVLVAIAGAFLIKDSIRNIRTSRIAKFA